MLDTVVLVHMYYQLLSSLENRDTENNDILHSKFLWSVFNITFMARTNHELSTMAYVLLGNSMCIIMVTIIPYNCVLTPCIAKKAVDYLYRLIKYGGVQWITIIMNTLPVLL